MQYGINGFLLAVKRSGAQEGREHFRGTGGVLDHSAKRCEVPVQHGNGAVCADGIVIRTDNVRLCQVKAVPLIGVLQPFPAPVMESVLPERVQVFAERLSGDRHHIQVQVRPELFHDGGHAARIIEEFRWPFARRTQVQEIMGAPVQSVKGIAVDMDAEFVGNGGQVQKTVGGAGDGGMHQNGVLKAFQRDDIGRPESLTGKLHGPLAGCEGKGLKIRAGGGQKRASGQGETQGFRHDLHGGSGPDKRTGTAAGTGVFLCPAEPGFIDFTALILRGIHAQLLQGKEVGACAHHTAGNHDAGDVHPHHAHQAAGHALVAAGDIHGAVKGRGGFVDFDHAGNHFPAGQGIIDAVRALAFPVAHVRAEIPRAVAAGLGDTFSGCFHQPVQMP